jgi:hypothetical protein
MTSSIPSKSDIDSTLPPVEVELDYQMVRAQMVNCVYETCRTLEESMEDLVVEGTMHRVADMSLLFGLSSNQEVPRIYRLTLLNPDGSQVSLARYDESGKNMEQDEFDQHVTQALSVNLMPTLGAAYQFMVKPPREVTHVLPYSVQ